jgi:hypothetical protein
LQSITHLKATSN